MRSPSLVSATLSLKVSGCSQVLRVLTCVVSKSKVVLFGGATGDTGKYIITGDTYTLDLISFKWTKLEGKYLTHLIIIRKGSGIAPSPRAAHGSTSVDQL